MWQAGRDGRLDLIADGLRDLVAEQDLAGHRRYAGITRLNLSGVLLWLGDVRDAASEAARAQVDLGGLESGSAEYVAAVAAEAKAVARLGHLDRANALIAAVLELPSRLGRDEACAESAEIRVDFGDVEEAASLLDMSGRSRHIAQYANLVAGGLALRRGDAPLAASFAKQLALVPCTDIAGLTRGQILRTRAARLADGSDQAKELEALQGLVDAQHSRPGESTAELLRAVMRDAPIHSEVVQLHPDDTYVLSQLAEEISDSLHKFSSEAMTVVRAEAVRRPARWATALRLTVSGSGTAAHHAVELLAEVGSEADASLLRALSTREKAIRPHAAALTRRLAPPVEIADLGTVEIRIDGAPVTRRLRRKVLGLLCFVSSRPGMASTRDEALDALWPDLTPSTAVNSLHQTIYFLRRLLKPDYKEGIGAGYLQFDGEVLSFDPALVKSASRRCWELIASWEGGDRGALEQLLRVYRGKFARDFAYED